MRQTDLMISRTLRQYRNFSVMIPATHSSQKFRYGRLVSLQATVRAPKSRNTSCCARKLILSSAAVCRNAIATRQTAPNSRVSVASSYPYNGASYAARRYTSRRAWDLDMQFAFRPYAYSVHVLSRRVQCSLPSSLPLSLRVSCKRGGGCRKYRKSDVLLHCGGGPGFLGASCAVAAAGRTMANGCGQRQQR
jgi:hypothetical protein